MPIYEIFKFGVHFFVLVRASQQMELSCSHSPLSPYFLVFVVVVCFFFILFNTFILQCNNISIVLEFTPFHADKRLIFLIHSSAAFPSTDQGKLFVSGNVLFSSVFKVPSRPYPLPGCSGIDNFKSKQFQY